MKQCRNCGWSNKDADTKCVKCGCRLPEAPDAASVSAAGGAAVSPTETRCARCGYVLSSLLCHCPVCHAEYTIKSTT